MPSDELLNRDVADLEKRVRALEQSMGTHIAYAKAEESAAENTRSDLRQELDKLWAKLDTHYVTMAEFRPVRLIVFGLVGTILLSVFGAILGLVLKAADGP